MLPILVLTERARGTMKKTDGWVLETLSHHHKEADVDAKGGISEELVARMAVSRIPYNVEALRDTNLLSKLPFGRTLTNDLLLAGALEAGDIKKAQAIAENPEEEVLDLEQPVKETPLNRTEMDWFDRQPSAEGGLRSLTPQEAFALHLTDALTRVQYVVWLEKESGKLRQGILCQTLNQVSYALVAGSLGNVGGLGACRRCEKLFPKRRTRAQLYCSTSCRVAAAMKRYYRKKKKRKRRQRKRGRLKNEG